MEEYGYENHAWWLSVVTDMPCFHPIQGYRSLKPNKNGKRPIIFKERDPNAGPPVTIPCGRCVGCRLERSRQWAVRCVHQASLHDDNCYLTLTYNDENLPDDNSLNKRDFQLFMKRYRTWLQRTGQEKIKFFHCGEYGDDNNRPHYHAIIFNHDFSDKKFFKMSNGYPLYISDSLSELWPLGYHTIGSVTFESAAYCARYVMKKVTGELADDHYLDPETGVLRQPEYTTQSNGIGLEWLNRFETDVYPSDEIILSGGIRSKPPRFYDKKLEEFNPELMDAIRKDRVKESRKNSENNTKERLRVREACTYHRLDILQRKL